MFRRRIHRAFTLIELGLVLFISAVLLAVFFQVTSLSSQYLAVRAKSFSLASYFRTAANLSLQSQLFQEQQRLCGAGLLFYEKPGGYRFYYVVASIKAKTALCTNFPDADFNLIGTTPLTRVFRTLQLTQSLDPAIDQLVLGDSLGPLKLTVKLDNDPTPLIFTNLLLLFRSPYAETLLFTNAGSGPIANWQYVDFELSLRNEKSTIRVYNSGQILLQ